MSYRNFNLGAACFGNIQRECAAGDRATLLKFNRAGSGYPFPVPLRLIAANIWMHVRVVLSVLTTRSFKGKQKYLKAKGLHNPIDFFSIYEPDVVWITQSLPETDFPVPVIPDNVKPCGPISLSTASAAERDPELASWLERAPTILINLGTLFRYDESSAKVMAGAVRTLLEQTDVQVLWKLGKFENRRSNDEFSEEFHSVVSEYLGSRLRLKSWINIDPTVMLETGNIVASVHHGGASSFYEAVEYDFRPLGHFKRFRPMLTKVHRNGVPQIVLPMWADCYEFANRAEWLGIGIWGSRSSPLNWSKEDLSSAFLSVLANTDEAESMRVKARQLGKRFQVKPGRMCAAEELTKLLDLKNT